MVRQTAFRTALLWIIAVVGATACNQGPATTQAQSGPTPTPAPVVVTPAASGASQQLAAGQLLDVKAGSVISGDIRINGQNIFDNDATSGLVVIIGTDTRIESPFGANVITGLDPDAARAVATRLAEDEKARNRLARVDVVNWPDDGRQQ